ncbi:5-formyltetrahydrofolate cyclo-ligase [Staphylococcus sp. ACRSN]|uniref:5-formyltetrahydrofolate cyclo-ligase n=1 Tax=Staphylococcus sp. ACRSN TaxID=2918214 RepID=UPI001EF32D1B|nr:5-formyltetrahydrofolate cyclo-ligase [Staphylococcus sp. ACRSN]
MDKQILRRSKLNEMHEFKINDNKQSIDIELSNRLFDTDEYKQATRIGVVLSMDHEFDTYKLIESMLKDGKAVFVPKTDYQNKTMTFQSLQNLNDIGPDEKGINHVVTDTDLTNELELLIVPGVVFNQMGYRIGYGGGYFDKFLSQNKQPTVSLIYDFQLDQFKPESHDQPVDKLIIATTK